MERSAGVVLFRGEGSSSRFLLLYYPAGHWDFVKGHVEYGESERDAAVREAQEEAGISDIRFVEGFEKRIRYWYMHDNHTVHKKVVFFLGTTETRRVRLSHEHLGFVWADYNRSMRRLTFKNARRVLYGAHKFLRSRRRS